MSAHASRRARGRGGASRIAAALLVVFATAGARADEIARGDLAWDRRAVGAVEGRALAEPIRSAIDAYERALEARPGSLEARWKLLRALHFEGEFAAPDEARARESFERACAIAEEGLDRLARELGSAERLDELPPDALRALLEARGVSPRDVARLHFWSAIGWGAASRAMGLFATVREGVANRLFRYANVAIALEPELEDGGAFRLLGRLHARLPRVPLVSGWVDQAQALPLVERAGAIAPEHPGNRLLLALTLLDLAPERRDEAMELLRQVAALTPRASTQVEDLAIREEARSRVSAAVDSR